MLPKYLCFQNFVKVPDDGSDEPTHEEQYCVWRYTLYVNWVQLFYQIHSEYIYFLFSVIQQPQVGQVFLFTEDSRPRSEAPHSIGFLCTSDRPVAEVSIPDNTNNTHKKQTSLPPAGFEPAIPATARSLKLHNIPFFKMFPIPKCLTHIWIYNVSVKHDKTLLCLLLY